MTEVEQGGRTETRTARVARIVGMVLGVVLLLAAVGVVLGLLWRLLVWVWVG
ncbi:hypothetical protein AB0B88_16330 [Micromonospora haikouensis]|uniref:hypothetical protein n=1 Tax=Micromonospora haikouensis TaxID=686309 RepID=UPI0033C7A3B2